MMIYDKGGVFVVLLIYVDDIIVTGTNTAFINNLIIQLNKVSSLKDLGDISYFLGVEVTKTDDGLHLCQAKYIKELLHKVLLKDSKPTLTPIVIGTPLLKVVGTFQYCSKQTLSILFIHILIEIG